MSLNSSAATTPSPQLATDPSAPVISPPVTPTEQTKAEPKLSSLPATDTSKGIPKEINANYGSVVEHSELEKSPRSTSASSATLSTTTDDSLNNLKQAALSGDKEAMFKLGVCYFEGKGVEENKAEAFQWFQKAADQNDASAQYNLGVMYSKGYGVEVDMGKAFYWFQKAALQGDRSSQRRLSRIYQEGKGVPKNSKLVTYWMMRSRDSESKIEIDQEQIELLDFVPGVIQEYQEFKLVNSIVLKCNYFSDDSMSHIDKFIRSNSSIKFLTIDNDRELDYIQAKVLAEALAFNTQLLKCSIKIIEKPSEQIRIDIQSLLNQNEHIEELRKYVEDHPLINTFDIPLDVIKILDKQIIVSYLKSGQTKEATKKAIDEFFLIVRTTALAKDSKTN